MGSARGPPPGPGMREPEGTGGVKRCTKPGCGGRAGWMDPECSGMRFYKCDRCGAWWGDDSPNCFSCGEDIRGRRFRLDVEDSRITGALMCPRCMAMWREEGA